MAYAKGTTVDVATTEVQIKRMLQKAGASATMFYEAEGRVVIAFSLRERHITFKVPLPDPKDERFWKANGANQHTVGGRLAPAGAANAHAQAVRELWRALHLCIKAKLEGVDAGIETFEDAFLAHVTMPDGETVGEKIKAPLALSYKTKSNHLLLPAR